MKFAAPSLVLLSVATLAAACGVSTNGATASPTPTPNETATPTPAGYTATTIHDVQSGAQTATQVELDGVVVTAVDPVAHGISFWAQDAGGGEYSGTLVYDLHGITPVDLQIGDIVTIQGTHDEYSGPASYPWHSTQTEVVPDSVVVTGHGSPTVTAIADLAELKDFAGEVWEGCLVEVDAVHVASVGVGYGEYSVGDSAGNYVRVDRPMIDTFEPRLLGEAIPSVVGVVEDSWDHYHLAPRLLDDVSGTSVNAPIAVTLHDLQDKTSPNHPVQGQLVTVTDALVSGTAPWVSSSGRSKEDFWLQTASQAAALEGIFVEDANYTNPTVSLGDTVSVTGKYVEKGVGGSGLGTNTSSELVLFKDYAVGAPTAVGSAITPLTLTLATLKGSDAKTYDGVLVQLADAAVTVSSMNPDAPDDYGEYVVTDGTSTVRVDGRAYQTRDSIALNDSLTLLRGLFYKKAGIWAIEPRAAADVAKQ